MTSSKNGTVFAAALLLMIGGVCAAPAELMQNESEESAAEAPAMAYIELHGAEFASYAPAITPEQVESARTASEIERPVLRPRRLSDGGHWVLPA